MAPKHLKTKRLYLRDIAQSDADQIEQLMTDGSVAHAAPGTPHPYTCDEILQRITDNLKDIEKKTGSHLAICLQSTDQLIGLANLTVTAHHRHAEIGFWLGSDYRNQGYMTEALNAAIDHWFNAYNLNRITAHHLALNTASSHVMQKLGMTQEGIFRNHIFHNNQYHDIVWYGLLKSEWGKHGRNQPNQPN
ncbi:Putative ribosomal N-acetyltransferase YdaF [Poriferisphaera corsica]|uniref:Ribosomal N-acetyltransferase YdaF n=1 Tax=Poriferisphaera corsica TaxID=2528020 RepID=A0A517YPS3_9BACT|nr:GNAT family protein [Poriferisphaera corsica]QDU32223.1 Putative ribosomal N-acetyltransferase YdaF [Poriferisphaera corsica]